MKEDKIRELLKEACVVLPIFPDDTNCLFAFGVTIKDGDKMLQALSLLDSKPSCTDKEPDVYDCEDGYEKAGADKVVAKEMQHSLAESRKLTGRLYWSAIIRAYLSKP
jgi:hypothetical protein